MSTTIQKELKTRDLDFDPKKMKLYAQIGRKRVLVPGHYAIMRVEPDRSIAQVLGVAGADYHAVPNRRALGFLDPILQNQSLGAEVTTIDSYKNGAAIAVHVQFASARLSQEFSITKKVTVITSHDGNRAIHAVMNPSITDENGMRVGVPLAFPGEFRFRHTSGVNNRLDSANRLLGLTDEMFANVQQDLPNFGKVEIELDSNFWRIQREDFLDMVAPAKEKGPGRVDRERAGNVLDRHMRRADGNPTYLNVFLGLAEYITKWRRVRKKEQLEWGNLTGRGLDMMAKVHEGVRGATAPFLRMSDAVEEETA